LPHWSIRKVWFNAFSGSIDHNQLASAMPHRTDDAHVREKYVQLVDYHNDGIRYFFGKEAEALTIQAGQYLSTRTRAMRPCEPLKRRSLAIPYRKQSGKKSR
jgi:hypothetical protein